MIVKLAGIKIDRSKLTSMKKLVNGLSGHTGNWKIKSRMMPADYLSVFGPKSPGTKPSIVLHSEPKVNTKIIPGETIKKFEGSGIVDRPLYAKLSEPMRLLRNDPNKLSLFQAVGMKAQSGIRKVSRKLNSALGIDSTNIKDGSMVRHFKNNSAIYTGAGLAATASAVSSFKQRKNGDQNDY